MTAYRLHYSYVASIDYRNRTVAIFVFQNRQNEEIIKKNPLANRTELSCIEHHTIQRTIVDTNQTNPCSPDYKSDYDRTYLFIYSQGSGLQLVSFTE